MEEIIADRQQRGVALANKSAEACDIVEEFKMRFPDLDPSAVNTVRNKL